MYATNGHNRDKNRYFKTRDSQYGATHRTFPGSAGICQDLPGSAKICQDPGMVHCKAAKRLVGMLKVVLGMGYIIARVRMWSYGGYSDASYVSDPENKRGLPAISKRHQKLGFSKNTLTNKFWALQQTCCCKSKHNNQI